MPSEKINFTIKNINAIPLPPKGKRAYYRDIVVRGLTLDVRSSGTKSFYLYKFLDGKPERIFLGIFPDLSIENARKHALTKLGEIAAGRNPLDEVRKQRIESTFGEMFNEYIERYSKKHKKSWLYEGKRLADGCKHLGRRVKA